VRSIIEKVVYIDISQMYGVENPEILMKLVKLVASNPGMLLDHSNLAQTLSTDSPVSRARISRYVHHLEQSYMLRLIYNYSGSGMVSERKLKKAYLSNPTFSIMSGAPVNLGKLAEQSLVLSTGARFFWRNPQKEEVDIILDSGEKLLPVEIKFQSTITKSDMRGLRSFMRRRNVDRGILITKDTEKTIEVPEGNIRMIPAWKVALFGIED
jgi:predicted AAA+ superfamily ATPase